MEELTRPAWTHVRPLYESMDQHLAPHAVLAGAEPGRVWADDPAAPRTALVQAGRRFYLAGDPSDDALNTGLHALLLEASKAGALVLYYASPGWATVLARLLAGRESQAYRRHTYELQIPGQYPVAVQIPAGLALRPVDRGLLDETGLGHLDALKKELVSECPSVEFFLAHRFGVCLVAGRELAAWCLAEHTVGDRCEVGLETRPAYRRRGLATLVTRALVEAAAARGITGIGWHCYAGNAGSIATARKAGFEKAGEYEVLVVRPPGATG
jgi:GNAT superfamily N-acetyltransferase